MTTIPEWHDCEGPAMDGTATPLQKFIYENEPAAPEAAEQFRAELQAIVDKHEAELVAQTDRYITQAGVVQQLTGKVIIAEHKTAILLQALLQIAGAEHENEDWLRALATEAVQKVMPVRP